LDVREFSVTEPGHQDQLRKSSDLFHHAVYRFPVPVIAAVDGIAYGGGFDLALLCDLRIATHRARFGHPEAAVGPGVYGPLHDLAGGAVARELVLTGRDVGADEALALHLVTELTEPDHLAERAMALARQVSRAPREILIANKAKFIARSAIAPARQPSTCDLLDPVRHRLPERPGSRSEIVKRTGQRRAALRWKARVTAPNPPLLLVAVRPGSGRGPFP
jgi:enoyl-CoA hydratase/carnithine racemase